MVKLTDLEENFFGLVLQGASDDSKKIEFKSERPLHITMASLDTSIECDQYVPVTIQKNDKKFILCTLSKSANILQQTIELELNIDEALTFYLDCKIGAVHLTGYYLSEPQCLDDHNFGDNQDLIDSAKYYDVHGDDDEDDDETDDDEDDDDDDDEEDEDDDEDDDEDESEDEVSKRKAIQENENAKKKLKKEKIPTLVSNDIKKTEEKVQLNQTKTITGGVIIKDTKIGNGPEAKKGKTVQVYYIGKLQNGKQFDACIKGKPFKFRLGSGQVIKGWDVGFENMKVGGKRTITVPPHMGYGSQKMGNDIPANSTLIFDVELKSVN